MKQKRAIVCQTIKSPNCLIFRSVWGSILHYFADRTFLASPETHYEYESIFICLSVLQEDEEITCSQQQHTLTFTILHNPLVLENVLATTLITRIVLLGDDRVWCRKNSAQMMPVSRCVRRHSTSTELWFCRIYRKNLIMILVYQPRHVYVWHCRYAQCMGNEIVIQHVDNIPERMYKLLKVYTERPYAAKDTA